MIRFIETLLGVSLRHVTENGIYLMPYAVWPVFVCLAVIVSVLIFCVAWIVVTFLRRRSSL